MKYLIFILITILLISCYDSYFIIKKQIDPMKISYSKEAQYRTESETYTYIDNEGDTHIGIRDYSVYDHDDYYRYFDNEDYILIVQYYDSKNKRYDEKEHIIYTKNKYIWSLFKIEQLLKMNNSNISIWDDNNTKEEISYETYLKELK